MTRGKHYGDALTWLERNMPGGIRWVARALAETAPAPRAPEPPLRIPHVPEGTVPFGPEGGTVNVFVPYDEPVAPEALESEPAPAEGAPVVLGPPTGGDWAREVYLHARREGKSEALLAASPAEPAPARSCLWHADCDASDRALREGVQGQHPPASPASGSTESAPSPEAEGPRCATCGGAGFVKVVESVEPGVYYDAGEPCDACGGTGRSGGKP